MGYIAEIRKLRKQMKQAYDTQEYKQSALLARKIIQIYLDKDDCSSMEYAEDLHNLAVTLDTLGMYHRASDYYKRSATLKKKLTGETLSYADTINNLGIVSSKLGETKKALEYHEKTLEIRKHHLGTEHIDTIHSMLHVGNVYAEQRNFIKAITFHSQALQKIRELESMPILDQSDILAELAADYDAIGKYQKSIDTYEKALQLNEQQIGEYNFPQMVWTLSLAEVCEKAGRLDWAVEHCEKAIQIRRHIMPESHLDYINSLNSFAEICKKAELFERSLQSHQQAQTLVENVLGKEHIFYSDLCTSIGIDYANLGQYDSAVEIAKQGLSQKIEQLGKEHAQIAVSLIGLAKIYEKQGNLVQCIYYLQKALKIRQTKLGRYHEASVDIMRGIAKVFCKVGAYEIAQMYAQEALELQQESKYEKENYIQMLYLNAEIAEKQKQYDTAESYCQKAISVVQELYGEHHPTTAHAWVELALFLQKQQQYESAITILKKAADIQKELLDEDNPYYLETLEYLAQTYAENNDFENAITYYLAKNDGNFEETPQELSKAAETLLAVAICYALLGKTKKAESYVEESKQKMAHAELPPTDLYEKRLKAYQDYNSKGISPFLKTTVSVKFDTRTEKKRWLHVAEFLIACIELMQQQENYDTVIYCNHILFLGIFLEKLGRTQELLQWYQIAEQQAESNQYIVICEKLANIYQNLGEYEKAIKKLVNIKSYIEEYDDVKTIQYCEVLGALGDCYIKLSEKEHACILYQAYHTLHRQVSAEQNEIYVKRLLCLANQYYKQKKYEESVELYSQLALTIKEQEGEEKQFMDILLKAAKCQTVKKSYKEAELLLDRVLLLAAREGRESIAYGKWCDKIGRMYAKNQSWERAADTLAVSYHLENNGKNCMTKQGKQTFLNILRNLQEQKQENSSKQ